MGGAYSLAACSDDSPKGSSIFNTSMVKRNSFEKWLLQNYTNPYNIRYSYRLRDIDTETSYNLSPADSAKATKLAIIFKYLWLDAYAEVAGADFVKANAPRTIVAIGSPAINTQGLQTAATAEGGYTVRVYRVNELDQTTLENQDLLTEYYFHTIHHEFTLWHTTKSARRTIWVRSGFARKILRLCARDSSVRILWKMQAKTLQNCSLTTSPRLLKSGRRNSTKQENQVAPSLSINWKSCAIISKHLGTLTSISFVMRCCVALTK